jgi:hypothetical protein
MIWASRFDADIAGRCVLPSPDEAADVNAAFARRYERLVVGIGSPEVQDLSFCRSLSPGLSIIVKRTLTSRGLQAS